MASSDSQMLPLFPLGMVVFPGQTIPLHIFEERYKQMVADCAAHEGERYAPFGLSFEHDSQVASIGCAVEVIKVTRRYSNGTFDIVCRGGWRYRTLEVRQGDQPYLTAQVQRLDDEEDGPSDPSLQLLVQDRLVQLADLASQDMGALGYSPQIDSVDRGIDLSDGDTFGLAQRIDLPPVQRQKLLELLSENARLQYLLEYLDELLPTMQKRQERQRRVKTNGHGRHH